MALDRFDRVNLAVGVVFLNMMLLLGLLRIINRYFLLPISLYWIGEIIRNFLAIMTIIGIPYLFKNEADISFLPVLKRVVSNLNILLIIRNMILIGFSVVFVWSAWLSYNLSYSVTLATLDWFKIRWVYLLFGVIFAILIVLLLVDTYNRISEFNTRNWISELREDDNV